RKLRQYVKIVPGTGNQPATYKIDIKFVMIGEQPFKMKVDLVQVAYLNSTVPGVAVQCDTPQFPDPANPDDNTTLPEFDLDGWMYAPSQGADMTYDFQQDSSDVQVFTAAFVDQSPAADLNNDGEVDTSDVVQFFDAFTGTGGQ
ncbi:MAG: hypothetical protein NTV94_17940, partial [Planctomycetota bacterium]|nr:hypothetical protein [Planctomycetota bacterium]